MAAKEEEAVQDPKEVRRGDVPCMGEGAPSRCLWEICVLSLSLSNHRRAKELARAAQQKIPTLPVPDVRFEQSYLLSIQREAYSTLSAKLVATHQKYALKSKCSLSTQTLPTDFLEL